MGGVGGLVLSLLGAPILGQALASIGVGLAYSTTQLESQVDKTGYSLYGSDLSAVDKHSIALMTILLYGEKEWSKEGGTTKWQRSAQYILPATLDDEIANNAFGLAQETTGAASPGAQMSIRIAYSVLNEGNLVFGNTAVRALYNDADDLGSVIDLISSRTDDPVKYNIGRVIAEFAGLLADKKVESKSWAGAIQGVLSRPADSPNSQISVDLSKKTWSINGQQEDHEIFTKADLVNSLIEQRVDKAVLQKLDDWMSSRSGGTFKTVSSAVDGVSIFFTNTAAKGPPNVTTVNRRPIGTPYRRAKGTPFALRGSVDAGRGFRAAGGVGRA